MLSFRPHPLRPLARPFLPGAPASLPALLDAAWKAALPGQARFGVGEDAHHAGVVARLFAQALKATWATHASPIGPVRTHAASVRGVPSRPHNRTPARCVGAGRAAMVARAAQRCGACSGGAACGDDAMRALVAPRAAMTRRGDGHMPVVIPSPRRHDVAGHMGDACVAPTTHWGVALGDEAMRAVVVRPLVGAARCRRQPHHGGGGGFVTAWPWWWRRGDDNRLW